MTNLYSHNETGEYVKQFRINVVKAQSYAHHYVRSNEYIAIEIKIL